MPKDLFEEHGIDLLEEAPEQQGLLQRLGQGYMNYAGGALRGMGQAAGDLGASAVNWPISGVEHLTGHKLPHVPHPDLLNKNPSSLAESIGQNLGQLTGGLALPGGTGLKAAQLAGKGYQALRAGKQLPMLGKLLAGASGGALEGAAGNEENRGLGAVLGGLGGAAGYAIPSAIKGVQSMRAKNIAKEIPEEVKRLKDYFSEVFTSHLGAGEEAGANRFLKHEGVNKNLFKKGGESKLLHALDEYNANPTLSNAHEAQSDLNKIVSKYAHKKDSKLERDLHKEALKTKNRLLQQISNAFEQSGVKQHGAGYQNAREEYAHHLGPYLNSKAISALLGKGTKGRPTLRPQEFADKLLQEEEFLAQSGQKHPGLLRREKTKNVIRNPLVKHALTAATAGTAAAFLPHEIRKLLGQ
jgi:hypothetical protein